MSRELREEVRNAVEDAWNESIVTTGAQAWTMLKPIIAREVEAAKRETREACAKVAETCDRLDHLPHLLNSDPRQTIAAAIRSQP